MKKMIVNTTEYWIEKVGDAYHIWRDGWATPAIYRCDEVDKQFTVGKWKYIESERVRRMCGVH